MILRSEKGAPLTFEELDGNFKEIMLEIQRLKDDIAKLQGQGTLGFKVEQAGEEVTLKTPLGKILGTFVLPHVKPHIRGPWQEGESYKIFDWIMCSGKTYSCIKSHRAKEFHKEKSSCWEIVIDPQANIETH